MTLEPVLERPFLDKHLAMRLTSRAWEFPFADFAHELARAHGGTIESRVADVDEAYWDIRIRGQLLTLHRQHYLGVFLCATEGTSEALLRELMPFAADYLSRHPPPREE